MRAAASTCTGYGDDAAVMVWLSEDACLTERKVFRVPW